MTSQHKNKASARLLRSLYLWHRFIGLAAALFVVLLALTGLLLNHTEELDLDSSHINSAALLDWYGIHAPAAVTAYHTDTLTVAALDGQIYINRLLQPGINGELAGAVDFSGMVIVALAEQLLLYTPQGEMIERLDSSSGLPAGIKAIGISTDHQLAIHAAQGDYSTNADFLSWQPVAAGETTWSMASELSDRERSALEAAWRGTGLSLERVLLDLHSGRILGTGGVYLMDGAAILFLLLAASGVWLWGRRRASVRAHQRKLRHSSKTGEPGQHG
jgi:hypothetical protein